MSTTFRKIALIGATGNLGSKILTALTRAGFTVTAVQRADSQNVAAEASKSIKVDLSSTLALTNAFKGHDVVVSAVPNPTLQVEKVWIEAAIAAGVKRIVPSEYSSNLEVEVSRKLPIVKDKVEVRAYVESIADKIEWSSVNNGPFFTPYTWTASIFGPNVNTKITTYHDGGNTIVCTSTLERIAEGVAQMLLHPAETRNKPNYVYSAAVTERKMHDIVKKLTGINFEEKMVSIDAVVKETQIAMDNGNLSMPVMMSWYLPFVFKEEYGCDFRHMSANRMLGLKEMSEEELEDTVRSGLKQIGAI